MNRTLSHDARIDLVLVDVNLPDIEGGKLYPLLMKARPELRVIVFSGYAIDGPAQEILDAGAQDFIQRPFSLAVLSGKLQTVVAAFQDYGFKAAMPKPFGMRDLKGAIEKALSVGD